MMSTTPRRQWSRSGTKLIGADNIKRMQGRAKTQSGPFNAPCVICKAKPGELCVTRNGDPARTHKARRRLTSGSVRQQE